MSNVGIEEKFDILLKHCVESKLGLRNVIDCMEELKLGFNIQEDVKIWEELLKELEFNTCTYCKRPIANREKTICRVCELGVKEHTLEEKIKEKEEALEKFDVTKSPIVKQEEKRNPLAGAIIYYNNMRRSFQEAINKIRASGFQPTVDADAVDRIQWLRKHLDEQYIEWITNVGSEDSEQDAKDLIVAINKVNKVINGETVSFEEDGFLEPKFTSLEDVNNEIVDNALGYPRTVFMLDREGLIDDLEYYYNMGQYSEPPTTFGFDNDFDDIDLEGEEDFAQDDEEGERIITAYTEEMERLVQRIREENPEYPEITIDNILDASFPIPENYDEWTEIKNQIREYLGREYPNANPPRLSYIQNFYMTGKWEDLQEQEASYPTFISPSPEIVRTLPAPADEFFSSPIGMEVKRYIRDYLSTMYPTLPPPSEHYIRQYWIAGGYYPEQNIGIEEEEEDNEEGDIGVIGTLRDRDGNRREIIGRRGNE